MWPLKGNIEQTSITRVNVNSLQFFIGQIDGITKKKENLKRYDHNEIILNKPYYA